MARLHGSCTTTRPCVPARHGHPELQAWACQPVCILVCGCLWSACYCMTACCETLIPPSKKMQMVLAHAIHAVVPHRPPDKAPLEKPPNLSLLNINRYLYHFFRRAFVFEMTTKLAHHSNQNPRCGATGMMYMHLIMDCLCVLSPCGHLYMETVLEWKVWVKTPGWLLAVMGGHMSGHQHWKALSLVWLLCHLPNKHMWATICFEELMWQVWTTWNCACLGSFQTFCTHVSKSSAVLREIEAEDARLARRGPDIRLRTRSGKHCPQTPPRTPQQTL